MARGTSYLIFRQKLHLLLMKMLSPEYQRTLFAVVWKLRCFSINAVLWSWKKVSPYIGAKQKQTIVIKGVDILITYRSLI